MTDIPILAVGVAIIDREKKVLVAKRSGDRPMADKWEFPGGKLEEGESLEGCGVREIKEELELDILIGKYLGCEEIHYRGKLFHLHLFSASLKDEGQSLVLNVHSAARWLGFEEFGNYDFPAAKLSFTKELKKILTP